MEEKYFTGKFRERPFLFAYVLELYHSVLLASIFFFRDFQGNTDSYVLFLGSIVPITDQSSVRARLVEAV